MFDLAFAVVVLPMLGYMALMATPSKERRRVAGEFARVVPVCIVGAILVEHHARKWFGLENSDKPWITLIAQFSFMTYYAYSRWRGRQVGRGTSTGDQT
jgi:hypothetical protein